MVTKYSFRSRRQADPPPRWSCTCVSSAWHILQTVQISYGSMRMTVIKERLDVRSCTVPFWFFVETLTKCAVSMFIYPSCWYIPDHLTNTKASFTRTVKVIVFFCERHFWPFNVLCKQHHRTSLNPILKRTKNGEIDMAYVIYMA